MMQLRQLTSLMAVGALTLTSALSWAAPARAEEPPTPPSVTSASTPSETAPKPETATRTASPITAAMPLSSDAKIKAWQDLRFGLFIHWGVYSMYGGYYNGKKQWLGYPEQIKAWGGTREDFQKGGIPESEYIAMAQTMTIPDFNAQQWCQSAKNAGMKYLLVTSKHHDGFAMWDTKTTDYKFPHHSPTHRDPMKELADTCNSMGVKLAFYFSIIDWSKQKAEPYQNRNTLDTEMMNLIHAQLSELLSGNYGTIPELWFDMGNPTPEQSQQMADWVHELSPTTMVNSRVWNDKGDFEVGGDNHLVTRMTMGPWESIRSTFPKCWGYCTWPDIEAIRNNPNGVEQQTREEVTNLFTTVANGGQYLLNIGPRGTGQFDPFEMKILEGIQQWQTRHPNVIHGALPTYYPTQNWGYTVINGDAIYLGVTNWQNGSEITLPGAGNNVTAVSIDDDTNLGHNLTYRVEQESKNLVITLPEQAPEAVLPVIKVSTNGAPTYVPENAPAVEKGDVKTLGRTEMTNIASPLGAQGSARNIGYVRNEATQPVKIVLGADIALEPESLIDITVNDTTIHTTVAALSDGITGITLPAQSTARVIIERGQKTYFAQGFGGWRNGVTNLWFAVDDPDATPVTVHHEYVSADGTPLPTEIAAQAPQDRQVPSFSPKVSPTAPEQGVVTIGELNWKFIGWDEAYKSAVGAERLVFTGKWQSGPIQYDVTYRFVNNSPDHQMPRGIDSFIPQKTEHAKGSKVFPTAVRPDVFRDYSEGKTWRFVGWKNSVIENLSGPSEFVGMWEYQRDADITVTYEFVAKDGSALPQAVLDLLPARVTKEAPVSRLVPNNPSERTVEVERGTWIFDGYDKPLLRWPAGPTETFVGTWHFEKVKHPVTFVFKSADPERALPDLDAAKPYELEVTDSESAELPMPVPAVVADKNGEGIWTFSGWNVERLESVTEPTEVTGTWTFTSGKVGSARYVLAQGENGQNLPEILEQILPAPEPYIVGTTAKPAHISKESRYMELDGVIWKFAGWEPESIENAGEEVTFAAKWVTAASEVEITYAFTSPQLPLPAAVMELLPEKTVVAFADTVQAPPVAQTLVETVEGAWSFTGWDFAEITAEENTTITGTWTLTPRQYDVTISVSNLPDQVKALHETPSTVVFRDNQVCAPAPLESRIETDTHVWNFKGWEKECYTFEELSALAVIEGLSPSGSAGGTLFFAVSEGAGVVYRLSFVPVWEKVEKPVNPGANPVLPPINSDPDKVTPPSSDHGSTGSGNTASSGDTAPDTTANTAPNIVPGSTPNTVPGGAGFQADNSANTDEHHANRLDGAGHAQSDKAKASEATSDIKAQAHIHSVKPTLALTGASVEYVVMVLVLASAAGVILRGRRGMSTNM